MMRNQYLNDIIHRGNELALLEQAVLSVPKKGSPVRWIVAAAFGVLATLFPSVCTAQALLQLI